MDSAEFRRRTKLFALRVIRLCESLPNSLTGNIIRAQLLRCGTSVGANYRAACRARSPQEFAAKMGIVAEEADESIYWMELLIEAEIVDQKLLAELMKEGDEILAMTVASIKTTRNNQRK